MSLILVFCFHIPDAVFAFQLRNPSTMAMPCWCRTNSPPAPEATSTRSCCSTPGWLDQRWWRAPGLAGETAHSCAGRRGSWSQVNHCCHLPISHVICWPHRGSCALRTGLWDSQVQGQVSLRKARVLLGFFMSRFWRLFGLFYLSDLIMFPYSICGLPWWLRVCLQWGDPCSWVRKTSGEGNGNPL